MHYRVLRCPILAQHGPALPPVVVTQASCPVASKLCCIRPSQGKILMRRGHSLARARPRRLGSADPPQSSRPAAPCHVTRASWCLAGS